MDFNDRSNKTKRFFSIVNELLSASEAISPHALAAKHDINLRTVERYLKTLREEFKFPIIAEYRGKNRYYKLEGSTPFIKGMNFTDKELEVLYLSRDLFHLLHGTHFQHQMDRFFDKLESQFPLELKERMNQAVRFFSGPTMDLKPYSQQINAIAEGIRSRRKVKIVYTSKSGGRITKRYVIHPYTIIIHSNGLYFFGKKDKDTAHRVWAAHRMSLAEVLDENYIFDRHFNIDIHFDKSFGIFQGTKPTEITLKVKGEALKELKEMRLHRNIKRSFKRRGEMFLKLNIMGFGELRKFILSYCDEIEVVSPAMYRNEMKRILRAASSLYN
jgi:predicted DNA-binding transcriptional regulator YafY